MWILKYSTDQEKVPRQAGSDILPWYLFSILHKAEDFHHFFFLFHIKNPLRKAEDFIMSSNHFYQLTISLTVTK